MSPDNATPTINAAEPHVVVIVEPVHAEELDNHPGTPTIIGVIGPFPSAMAAEIWTAVCSLEAKKRTELFGTPNVMEYLITPLEVPFELSTPVISAGMMEELRIAYTDPEELGRFKVIDPGSEAGDFSAHAPGPIEDATYVNAMTDTNVPFLMRARSLFNVVFYRSVESAVNHAMKEPSKTSGWQDRVCKWLSNHVYCELGQPTKSIRPLAVVDFLRDNKMRPCVGKVGVILGPRATFE